MEKHLLNSLIWGWGCRACWSLSFITHPFIYAFWPIRKNSIQKIWAQSRTQWLLPPYLLKWTMFSCLKPECPYPSQFLIVFQARFLRAWTYTDCGRVKRGVKVGKMLIFGKLSFLILDAFCKIMSQMGFCNLLLATHTFTTTGVVVLVSCGGHCFLTSNRTFLMYTILFSSTTVRWWLAHLLGVLILYYSH